MKTKLWVWLTLLPGMNPEKITALLEHFESIEEIYHAEREEYQSVPGIRRTDCEALCHKSLEAAEKVIRRMEELGGTILHYEDARYPALLTKMTDPPYVLYLLGRLVQWEKIFPIGVVGTREHSEYGKKAAEYICTELAERGAAIVSGMAQGLDAVAANAALSVGGYTIAVLGSGVDRPYPARNMELYRRIIEHGTILSEYPPGTAPLGYHFPQRNRIISGLSYGIVAIEAPESSGVLITAQYALENGRDVFVVPGSIFSYQSRGANRLIQQGAKLVTCAQDVLDEYSYQLQNLEPVQRTKKQPEKQITIAEERLSGLSEEERCVVLALSEKALHIDQLKLKCGMMMDALNAILPMLEIYGLIQKMPGDNYQLLIG